MVVAAVVRNQRLGAKRGPSDRLQRSQICRGRRQEVGPLLSTADLLQQTEGAQTELKVTVAREEGNTLGIIQTRKQTQFLLCIAGFKQRPVHLLNNGTKRFVSRFFHVVKV